MKLAFRLFILSLFVSSFTLVGCGDKEEGGDDNGDNTEQTDNDDGNDGASSGNVAEKFKSEMITMFKEMVEVTEGVESVEDAEAADPKIEAAMNRIASMLEGIDLENMTIKDAMAFKELQNLDNDPEFKEWSERAEVAREKLKTDHPEAAAKLKELGDKHSEKLQTAIMSFMMKAMQMGKKADGGDAGGDDAGAEGDGKAGE